MDNQWVEIPETEGMYFASKTGEIKSADRFRPYISHGKKGVYVRKGKVLKQTLNTYGYPVVSIHVPGKMQKVVPVHKLIATTFIKNPNNEPQINHIDGNKKNNCVENLEWCSVKENLRHAYRIGLNHGGKPWKGKFGKNHIQSKPVIMLSKDGIELARFVSMTAAEQSINGATVTHISQCLRGKRLTSGGFFWKRAEG